MQINQLKNRQKFTTESTEVREKWLQEIRKARRVYSFQKWRDQRAKRKIYLHEITQWIMADIKYAVIWNVNLLLQLRKYGAIIKQQYGAGYITQWYRLAYLTFILRANPLSFRFNHFFKKDRWDCVKDYAFTRHIKVHNTMIGYPHQEELAILAHKLKFCEFCRSRQIPSPEVLAVLEQGRITLPFNGQFTFPKGDLFVKELSSGMGFGAKKFIYKEEYYEDLNGKKYSESDVHDYLIQYSKNTNRILVQHALKNHDSWKKFTNGSLATCRIVTGISPWDENEIITLFASFKMPVANVDADNYSKGSIVAPVEIDTGILSTAQSCKPQYGSFSHDVHPDTGHTVKGEVVPFWNELIEFTKDVHRHFKTISIGWDVCATEDGIQILEGNVEWGSDVIEGPAQRPMADTFFPVWFYGWVDRRAGEKVIPYSLPE